MYVYHYYGRITGAWDPIVIDGIYESERPITEDSYLEVKRQIAGRYVLNAGFCSITLERLVLLTM